MVTAAKSRRLGDSLSSGFGPTRKKTLVVSHRSLGVISERGTLAFTPNRSISIHDQNKTH
jgi:hypothetical protein